MFERFSSSAVNAMILATEESRRLRHDYVGTEHIFLGILGSNGKAASLLSDMGITLMAARTEVPTALIKKPTQKEKGWLSQFFGPSETPFTFESKDLLEKSWKEAQAQGLKQISDEHLLLALMTCEGPGKDILIQNKINMPELRERLIASTEKK